MNPMHRISKVVKQCRSFLASAALALRNLSDGEGRSLPTTTTNNIMDAAC
jgi:hypothetical protein